MADNQIATEKVMRQVEVLVKFKTDIENITKNLSDLTAKKKRMQDDMDEFIKTGTFKGHIDMLYQR